MNEMCKLITQRLRTYCVGLLVWLQELQQEHWTGLLVVWSSQISSLGSTGPGPDIICSSFSIMWSVYFQYVV